MMADERPLQLSRKKKLRSKNDDILCCIIHCSKASSKITPLSATSFQKIKDTCNLRARTGAKLENFNEDLPEKFIPHIYGYHRECYQKLTNIVDLTVEEEDDDIDDEQFIIQDVIDTDEEEDSEEDEWFFEHNSSSMYKQLLQSSILQMENHI